MYTFLHDLRLRALAILVIASLLAVMFNIPRAEAANTHSIDLERDSDQYLSRADDAALRLSGDFTVELWVKAETINSGSANALIAKDGAGTGWGFYLTGGGTPNWQTNEANNHVFASSLSTGTWYHLAVTQSGGLLKGYINGVEDVSTSYTDHTDATGTLQIGKFVNQTNRQFDGLVDEVRIWSVARTAQEINDTKATELNGNETGLVSYWKLNNALSDSGPSGFTLSTANSPTFVTDAAFSAPSEDLSNRKSVNESVVSSTVLQADDQLKVVLGSNKTYVIDGVIFASSTSATPDIVIAFTGQSGSIIRVGYTNDVNEMVLDSGDESSRINLPADMPTSIHIKGTVVTAASAGEFQLKWAQATSNGNATTVMAGSYLRAQEI